MANRLRNYTYIFLLILVIASCAPGDATNDSAVPEVKEMAATKPVSAYWPTNSWRESDPDEQGMDSALLQKMLAEIHKQGLDIDGLLVVRNDYIVTEKYYSPYGQNTLHDVYSVTKSVISALIGIAIHQGYINGVDDLVLDYFPERTFENDNALKRSITLEHLLTMSSGLEWDIDEMVASQDWVQYVLDQPIYFEPGTAFHYNSGNTHVLSGILQKTSGLSAYEFAQRHLFETLGIDVVIWQEDILGISKGGWGMKMRPRDMAKLGYLYLNRSGLRPAPKDIFRCQNHSSHGIYTWDIHGGCTKMDFMRLTA